MRVLAIDPSLRSTGYAVLEKTGNKIQSLGFGIVKNSPQLLPSSCLVAIHDRLAEIFDKYKPDCAAIEAVIYVQSYRTAITLGSARGAA